MAKGDLLPTGEAWECAANGTPGGFQRCVDCVQQWGRQLRQWERWRREFHRLCSNRYEGMNDVQQQSHEKEPAHELIKN